MQHLPRPFLLAALVVFCAAQAKAESAKPGSRPDRQIERIRTQDAGSRIDELRVGGETQSITVQPAANVPAYEVNPTDTSRTGSASETGNTGSRFWNVLKF